MAQRTAMKGGRPTAWTIPSTVLALERNLVWDCGGRADADLQISLLSVRLKFTPSRRKKQTLSGHPRVARRELEPAGMS